MENLAHALYMALAMLTFIIAFSYSLFLINKVNYTSSTIISGIEGQYYDSLALGKVIENNEDRNRSRIVGVDTIIPTLYRYYKESFAVKILDADGTLLQYFDTTTEGDVNAAKATITEQRTDKQKALLSLYDDSGKKCYMSGAPWLANINKDAKTRIDMYIRGGKGYINNTLVDFTSNNLKQYQTNQFKEIFTQYAYEGDTISDDSTGELVTLTGNKQISTKIIIIYQVIS